MDKKRVYNIIRYAVSVRWERERAEADRGGSGPIAKRKPSLEDFNALFCCCARRVGSMFFLLETRDGSPIVVAGPCWPFCTFVTTPLIVVLSGMVGYFIVSDPNTKLVRYRDSVVSLFVYPFNYSHNRYATCGG